MGGPAERQPHAHELLAIAVPDAHRQHEQAKAIERWMAGIWPHLQTCLAQEPPSDAMLESAQDQTVALCRQINPDFLPPSQPKYQLISVILVIVAIVVSFYLQK